jgi:tRNA A37 threonylcarbamoyladenosine biosynthesis protein TsaE
LKVLGWDDMVREPGNLILVEWPERCEGAIPASAIRIRFRYSGDNEREITYEKDE